MKEARRLGMGLDALIGTRDEPEAAPSEIELDRIQPNPFQPRTDFNLEEIRGLAESMKSVGLVQPLVVRRVNGHYELIAGERRFRAAKVAGLNRLPVVVRQLDDECMLKFAIVENVQRKDLNPIEKAHAFRELIKRFGYSQEQVAREVGMDRTTVSNFIRLLDLPAEIQDAIAKGLISQGHARALLACKTPTEQATLLKAIVKDDLSVRDIEARVYAKPNGHKSNGHAKDAVIADLEGRLVEHFGTKVRIEPLKKGGRIVIEYYSTDHLNSLLEQLGVHG